MMKVASIFLTLGFFLLSANKSVFSQDKYTPKEKEYMLNLARETLAWHLKYNKIPDPNPEELTDTLRENRPCFVTLNKKSGLRGCIGLFEFDRPLYKNIINRAIAAATLDYRFPEPVAYEELQEIKIEISILTEPKELKFSTAEDLLSKLTPFEDGVILYTEYGSSTFLPQVWDELPEEEMFLSNLCAKHGAPPDYWKTNYNKLRVQIYKAIHFEEESYGNRKIVGPNGAVVGRAGAKVIGSVSLLKEEPQPGGYAVKEGTELKPGTITTADSDLADK